jgi:hypothetical protein
MKKPRYIIFAFLLVFMAALIPLRVYATHGFNSEKLRFSVNGDLYDVWGYEGDFRVRLPAVRLRDAAFIFNNTSAQFDIAEPPAGGMWDVWIKRGEAYTPNGSEMKEIPEYRFASFGSYGFVHGQGFQSDPHRRIVVGFDGGDIPAITVTFSVIRDADALYVPLSELSYWLGFSIEWQSDRIMGGRYEIVTAPKNIRTPGHQLRADTFPTGSTQAIDYCYVLTVRTGPDNGYGILTYVYRGQEFTVLDYSRGFARIETSRGPGWIFAGFLSRDFIPSQ